MKADLFRKRIIIAVFALVHVTRAEEPSVTVFTSGNVYTLSEQSPKAQAIAVRDHRIVFVGSAADAKSKYANARIVDLHGKTVVPGFTDSHCHIFGIGEREMRLNLEGTNTREDFLAKVEQRARETASDQWIIGRGWIETFWKPPEFPSRDDLEKIAPGRFIYLTRADGHASVTSTAVLRAAGITRDTPDPFGGRILKDKNGEPTGMLIDHAQELVEKAIPAATRAEQEQAFLLGVQREVRLGWCEIQNAGSHKDDIEIIRAALEANKTPLRIYNAVYGPGADAESFLEAGPTVNEYGHRFTQRTIKVVFDGALGSRGAALLKPYSDRPDTSGFLREKPEELRPMFRKALERGIQVETHAIGDRANRLILDLYEEAFKAVPPNKRAAIRTEAISGNPSASPARTVRWRVEHAQNLDAADLPRFAKLGVIASMQPSHAISDLFFAPSRLGIERLAGAYAWKSLIKSGAIVCGGSDAPVERGEPMIEFYAAIARKSIKGESGDGWHPEQAVSREEALKMFTVSAAYAAFEENDKGTIEVGKLADFTVLSNDIMKIPEAEILKTRCEMTVIGGELVFQAED